MKPLRKGKARSELADGLAKLIVTAQPNTPTETSQFIAMKTAQLQAAVLGGAIEQACKDMGIDTEIFFRYMNENTWRLTRALGASGLLDKAGA